jgi:two-component system chemotaxis response regulator CheY
MAYNILIVDDSLTSRTFIRRALEMTGLPLSQIHQATNGQEALDLLQREWVDLVLSDINMPDMNGDEMVRRMRASDLFKSIPVVIVSTDCSERRMAEMTAAGVQAYLTKPVTPEDLKGAVERLLGKGPQ